MTPIYRGEWVMRPPGTRRLVRGWSSAVVFFCLNCVCGITHRYQCAAVNNWTWFVLYLSLLQCEEPLGSRRIRFSEHDGRTAWFRVSGAAWGLSGADTCHVGGWRRWSYLGEMVRYSKVHYFSHTGGFSPKIPAENQKQRLILRKRYFSAELRKIRSCEGGVGSIHAGDSINGRLTSHFRASR